jgi:hypothetical protein
MKATLSPLPAPMRDAEQDYGNKQGSVFIGRSVPV